MDHLNTPTLDLKLMDAGMLSFELLSEIASMPDADRRVITTAAQIATRAHRDQTRSRRGPYAKVPYVEHPMRVALRLLRWGVRDASIIAAALMHDVLEDASRVIVADFARHEDMLIVANGLDPEHSETLLRNAARDWLTGIFDGITISILDHVTNRVGQKRDEYAGKITEMVGRAMLDLNGADEEKTLISIGTLLVKASDLVDNAGSLQHQLECLGTTRVKRLASKYQPVIPVIQDALLTHLTRSQIAGRAPERAAGHLNLIQHSLTELLDKLD